MVAEIVSCFERTVAFMLGLVADVSDEEMTVQPPGCPEPCRLDARTHHLQLPGDSWRAGRGAVAP